MRLFFGDALYTKTVGAAIYLYHIDPITLLFIIFRFNILAYSRNFKLLY